MRYVLIRTTKETLRLREKVMSYELGDGDFG